MLEADLLLSSKVVFQATQPRQWELKNADLAKHLQMVRKHIINKTELNWVY